MTLTASDIYGRLKEMDTDDNHPLELANDVAESDVQTWLDGNDVSALESDANNQIERTTVTDLSTPQDIGDGDLSLKEVIESRGDDPSDFKTGYILRENRTVVQYFKRDVGGKQPITEADVQSELDDHVAEIVDNTVNAELMSRAKTEFGA